MVKHPPTGTDLLGVDADTLMTDVFNVFGNRYVLKDPLPEGRYDLRVNSVDVPQTVLDSAVQQAVLGRFTFTDPVKDPDQTGVYYPGHRCE